jgi:hypothetical protein
MQAASDPATAGPRANGGRYVYGFARAAEAQGIAEEGIGDPAAAVEVVSHGRVCALVSDTAPGPVTADRRNIDAHSRVVQAAYARFPVLPVRFGVVFPGDEDLRSALEQNGVELERLLGELEGRAELRVTVHYDEEAVLQEIVAENQEIARLRERTRAVPGDASYFERIRLGELVAKAMARKREVEAARILARLRPLATAVQPQAELPEAVVLRASFLVERSRLEEFGAALEEVSLELDARARVKVVGPLPPYTFADVRLSVPEGV